MDNDDKANVEKLTKEQKKIPDTNAFQDEFTRDFISSTNEVEDGYYLFESGLGGYTMLFPINAEMDRSYYQYEGKQYEEVSFGEAFKGSNYSYLVLATFEDKKSTKWIDSSLSIISGRNGYEGEFEEYTHNNNNIYFAEFTNKVNQTRNVLAYIVSNESNRALSLSYISICPNENEECKIDNNRVREKAKKIIHSVEFKP